VATADTERQVLNEAFMQGEKPTLRRSAHTILLSNRGYTINQISYILAVRRGTVSIWLNALAFIRTSQTNIDPVCRYLLRDQWSA
jgi:hypothetical protein